MRAFDVHLMIRLMFVWLLVIGYFCVLIVIAFLFAHNHTTDDELILLS